MKIISSLLSFFAAITLYGCATNPYLQFYKDNLNGKGVQSSPWLEPTTQEPKAYSTSDMERDVKRLIEDGYAMIGMSSFNGADVDDSLALSHARTVGAAVVLIKKVYTNTVSGSMPLTLPNTTNSTTTFSAYGSSGSILGSANTTNYGTMTTYIPYSVNRYDHAATFWVKAKLPIFGVAVRNLSTEEKQKLERNKGVVVLAVTKQSPAFEAGIIEGDVLIKINSEDFIDMQSLETVAKYAGQRVSLTVIRKGQERLVPVQLARRSY